MSAQLMSEEIGNVKKSVVADRKSDNHAAQMQAFPSLIFILALVLAAGVAISKMLDPTTLPVKHVRVEGNFQYLSEKKMQTLVSDVVRGGFFDLNVKAIKESLQNDPWVNWVAVQRVWPDSIRVHVKENIASTHWNEAALLNAEGQVFEPENAGSLSGIPYLSGPTGTENVVLEEYQKISETLSRFGLKVVSMTLNERRAWEFQLEDGPLVVLGRHDMDERFERFTKFTLHSLGSEINEIQRIDMRYTNGFAIQWRSNHSSLHDSGQIDNG